MRILVLTLAMLGIASGVVAETAVDVAIDANAAADGRSLSVKTFTLKHKTAEKAVGIIKPLLSAEGSVSLQANSLVVTDKPENVRTISAALAEFDKAPQAFRLNVRIVAASKAATPNVPEELKEIGAKLGQLLRFNSFESLGEANVEAKEGDPGLFEMPGYRADFRLGEYDPASDTIKVENFRLSRLQGDQLSQLVKTTVNVKLGQMFIMSATRSPESQRAIMVVVTAGR